MEVAKENGWYDEGTFNINQIYGDSKGPWDGVKWIESEMLKTSQTSKKITLKDILPDQDIDCVVYGCTSGTIAAGYNSIEQKVKAAKPIDRKSVV